MKGHTALWLLMLASALVLGAAALQLTRSPAPSLVAGGGTPAPIVAPAQNTPQAKPATSVPEAEPEEARPRAALGFPAPLEETELPPPTRAQLERPTQPWEVQVAQVLQKPEPPVAQARELLQLLPGMPEEALHDTAEEAVRRVPHAEYRALVWPLLVNPVTHGQILSALVADLETRPNEIANPALEAINQNPAHPYHQQVPEPSVDREPKIPPSAAEVDPTIGPRFRKVLGELKTAGAGTP